MMLLSGGFEGTWASANCKLFEIGGKRSVPRSKVFTPSRYKSVKLASTLGIANFFTLVVVIELKASSLRLHGITRDHKLELELQIDATRIVDCVASKSAHNALMGPESEDERGSTSEIVRARPV